MNVKKFTAPTMEQALANVKSTLGREAVILHTRCFSTGGLFGIGGRNMVEVTASDQVRLPERSRGPAAVSSALDRAYRTGGALPRTCCR